MTARPSELITERHERYFRRTAQASVGLDQHGLLIDGEYVMFYAERELMRRHAKKLVAPRVTDLLEVGFGLGVFAQEANLLAPRSYACVELHPAVAAYASHMLRPFSHPCVVLDGAWQEALAEHPATYSSVMLDDLSPEGYEADDFVNFVVEVIPTVLCPGGTFSFFCCGALDDRRSSALESVFDEVSVERCSLADKLPSEWPMSTDWFLIHQCRLGVASTPG